MARAEQAAFLKHDRFLRQAQDGRHVMAHEQDGPPLLGHSAHLAETLPLEFGITDSQHFVHYQDLRFQMGGNREGQAQVHARGVTFDRRIDELFDFRKCHDLVELALDLGPFHA